MENPIIIERCSLESIKYNIESWLDTLTFCNRIPTKVSYGINEKTLKARVEIYHKEGRRCEDESKG